MLCANDTSETTPQQNELTEAVRKEQKHPDGTRKTSNFSNPIFQKDLHHNFKDRLTKLQLFRTLKARNLVFA